MAALNPLTFPNTQVGSRSPTSLDPISAVHRLAPAARRLVVLIPDADTHQAELAGQLWNMASAKKLTVLLLGLCPNTQRELRARRRLVTLAAMIGDRSVPVETRLEVGADWIQAIRAIQSSSDILVCHTEQRVARWGLGYKPLGQVLAVKFSQPVGELTGFYPDLPPDFPGFLGQVIVHGIPILVVIVFTTLEALVHLKTQGAIYTVLIALCVLVEYSALGVWYYRFK